MTSTDTAVAIELDAYAREAAEAYLAATRDRDEAEGRRVKARDELLAFFSINDADVGLVAGEPVVRRVASDPMRLDTTRLREDEPATYRRYLVPTHPDGPVYSVREVRRGRS